jgi:ribonucleoside-diphosphate reductase alpha chain
MEETKDNAKVVEKNSLTESKVEIVLPKETLDFFKGDEIRARVFYEKYAFKDLEGKTVETVPSQMWTRVAHEMASVEATDAARAEWEQKFGWLLADFKFLPGGRILFGAGQKRNTTLLNCYVIPIKEDSIEAIFDWCKEAARTYSYGGGVGTDISVLRPRGAPVNNSAVYSTGSTSFMNIFSETTHTIGQAGRRGALMITIGVDHPDVPYFIKIKRDMKNVRYANISVRITDEFMNAVKNDTDFTLRFENQKTKMERKVRAKDLWNELVSSARDWAEPGLIFWDTVKRYSPSEYNGMGVITTNPCSEQPLDPYSACDLGSLNLSAFVADQFTDHASLDWESLEKATRYAARFLDDVLDYNMEKHPLRQQTDTARNARRIGIGITGLGDMLVKLKIRYDSDRALAFVDDLFNRIKLWAYDESSAIAKEKGAFPLFDAQKHLSMPFIKTLPPDMQEKIGRQGLRNVCILTVPPTGSISVLAGTSSGIEPIFAFSYTRRSESLSQEIFKVYHPLDLEYMKLFNISEESEFPDFFVPAHKIKPEFRVKLQGIIQRHIDSAISSTVNLPSETTAEEVGNIYFQAWEAGCKGITVYREGSREGILITDEEQKRKASSHPAAEVAPSAPVPVFQEWKRDRLLTGQTMKVRLPEGSLYVTANFDTVSIKEVFITLGKSGNEEKSYVEAIGRLVSKYLQMGGDVQEVVDSLKGIKSSSSIAWDRGMKIYSVPDAIGKSLEMMAGLVQPAHAATLLKPEPESAALGKQMNMPASVYEGKIIKPDRCPSCKEETLVNENGCFTCMNCSYTKCE